MHRTAHSYIHCIRLWAHQHWLSLVKAMLANAIPALLMTPVPPLRPPVHGAIANTNGHQQMETQAAPQLLLQMV